MKETFGPPTVEDEQQDLPAVREETLPAPALYEAALGEAAGEIGMDDVKIPRINVGQKTGELGEQFGFGSIILAKEVALYVPAKEGQPAADPVEFVVLRVKKEYRESTEFGSDEMGRVFDTRAEVEAAGLWIDWRDGADGKREAPPVSPQLQVQCLVRKPAGDVDPGLFPYADPEGDEWAMAVWTLGKSAYTAAGKALLTPFATTKDFNYLTQRWGASTIRKSGPQGVFYVPVVRRNGRTTAEFQQWAAELG